MRIPPKLKSSYKRLRWVEKTFLVLLVITLVLLAAAPASAWTGLAQFLTFLFGFAVLIRLARAGIRRAIWRLRNRIIVTYLFIAFVPVVLVITLATLALWAFTSQVAVYLVKSELDRRIDSLDVVSASMLKIAPGARAEEMRRTADLFYKDRFPGVEMILRTPSGVAHYPGAGTFAPPPKQWGRASGVVRKDNALYAWSHMPLPDGDFTVVVPLTPGFLSNLAPKLGIVQIWLLRETGERKTSLNIEGKNVEVQGRTTIGSDEQLPPPANRFDIEVRWTSLVPIADWNSPGSEMQSFLSVRSRPSAVYNALFTRKSDTIQGYLPMVLVIIGVAFLIVELFALIIGITMTRTITRTVHRLYEGTERVMHGDFSHRIEVSGNDQLAGLGRSFNQMTARIEELLIVAKEKERLQSELEIAREVQNQLYPKKVPEVRTLRLTAVCKPARMVSGDYFDYECVHDSKVALAIGDVAGKGISAALLMATVQSSLRTELRGSLELAAAAGNGSRVTAYSTSQLVAHLNEQLYSYTSPEKYATFYLGIYDDSSGVLTYTNAGHLPPILVRDGAAMRLNVDGTVVGAFPFAQYDESRLDLKPGDLLVCFTDGVTEPENEYGEMFGEDRLVQMVTRNAHRGEDQIVAAVIDAVEQWTGSPELQDDLTLMLARCH
jgi:sigma-B regulation protein RsbU (phosphoserine phosphatase)